MPLIIPPGFASVAIEFRADGDPDPWYVTYGIELPTVGGNFAAVADSQRSIFADAWEDAFPAAVSITAALMTVGQDGSEGVRVVAVGTTERRGDSTQAMLPQNCALLVDKVTNLGGRRGRGRCFLPGCVPEADTTAYGRIDPGIRAIFQSYADAWLVALNDGVGVNDPTPMVVLHSTGISSTVDPTPVTSLGVQQTISTQRRRLR